MFYVYGIFSTNGVKIKEIEAYWQRHLQQMPGDTLGGGQHSLRFQHITLIQEILATT